MERTCRSITCENNWLFLHFALRYIKNEYITHKKELQIVLENYRIIKSLGKGGMGEVFLAYDPLCNRDVALKQIREDLIKHKSIRDRFLREARIAAMLTHPSIIPIYAIVQGETKTYYTMPFIEGETLKQILRGKKESASIPLLMRLFLSVCQAVSYAHSKQVLHRDLKPENIIVGKYGEVMILDWGLAVQIGEPEIDEEVEIDMGATLTRPGKTVGTLAYMAPERARGEAATISTEVYALGAILYSILTLKLPFERSKLDQFLKSMQHERLLDPTEVAPSRDIPLELSALAKQCLSPNPSDRPATVDVLIREIENYLGGRPEWVGETELKIEKKEDWEFQENVLLSQHVAVTESTESMEWVNFMISKGSFPSNLRLETQVKFQPHCRGIGILLSIPEMGARKGLKEGYLIWISPKETLLCKTGVEVASAAHPLSSGEWHTIGIEKIDEQIALTIDGTQLISYTSLIPLKGTHIGILVRDPHFELLPLTISTSSQRAQVSCLSIPDTLLSIGEFEKALAEYRRIAASFSGRTEGREAAFRAGLTLLKQARSTHKKKERSQLFQLSLDEFEKLYATPGAPLEYLGKSLVYREEGNIDEEMKCLELALRKHASHPLKSALEEQVTLRLHESSASHRTALYHLALLGLRHLPKTVASPNHARLIETLKTQVESLPFVKSLPAALAFWLAKPLILSEMLEQPHDDPSELLFALLELGEIELVHEHLDKPGIEKRAFELALTAHGSSLKKAFKNLPSSPTFWERRAIVHMLRLALKKKKPFPSVAHLFPPEELAELKQIEIASLLQQKNWVEAEKLLATLDESHAFFLRGCLLAATQSKEAAFSHFDGAIEKRHPSLSFLAPLILTGKLPLKEWQAHAFPYERATLADQLALFKAMNPQL
jgi:serine/threonine protein kinase/tetratricopeptide (TPR) repeat protein